MQNIEIIKQLQEKHKSIDKQKLNFYIRNLVLLEFLRYNDNVEYFDEAFESIMLENKSLDNELDYALQEAIFITLQPLRRDIDIKNLEKIIMGWSGQILKRDITEGRYAKDLIHYFDDDTLDLSVENLKNISKEKLKEYLEYNNMVACEEKEKCTKSLLKMVSKNISKPNMSDELFYSKLGPIYYRFIRIHPFQDGNGRVSRMLVNYMFNQRNDCLPIGLSNDDISELSKIQQQASKHIYIASMGNYLSDLQYEDCTDAEKMLTANIGTYLKNKQNQAKAKLFGAKKENYENIRDNRRYEL